MIKLILASVIAMLLGILIMGILPVAAAKVVIKRNPNSWSYRGEAVFTILMLCFIFIPITVLYMTLPAPSILLTLTLSSYTIGAAISAIALRIAARRKEMRRKTPHTPV